MSTPAYINVVCPEGEVVGTCGYKDQAKAFTILQTAGVVCEKAVRVLEGEAYQWQAYLSKAPAVEQVVKSMRAAVKRGKNFYQWRKTLLIPPRLYNDQEMQLKYEKVEEAFKDMRPDEKGQWILLTINKTVDRKQMKFLLFQDKLEAGKKGIELYGRGNFYIEDFIRYKRTSDFKVVQRFFAIKARLNAFKK